MSLEHHHHLFFIMKSLKAYLLIPGLIAILLQGSFAKPAACQIALADGQRKTGFLALTNDKGVKFTYSENESGPGEQFTHAQILAVVFTDENDIMGPARHAYSRSNYEEAEAAFKAVATEYDNLWGISREKRGNFASEARFFQIDCLRRLGRFGEIGPAFDTNTGKSLENTLPEVYLPKLKLFKLWQEVAAENWDGLAAGLKEYEQPVPQDRAGLVPVPVFNAESPATLVQLAYMRGKVFAAKGDKENALRDFYRVITLDYGSDLILSQKAMDEALAIQAADEQLKENYAMKTEIHALARIYQEAYGKGQIGARFREFAIEPEMPEELRKQREAQMAAKEAEKAAAAAAADGNGDAPAPATPEDKKPDDKKPDGN